MEDCLKGKKPTLKKLLVKMILDNAMLQNGSGDGGEIRQGDFRKVTNTEGDATPSAPMIGK